MADNQIEKLFGSDSVGLATTESPGIASFSPADFLVTATGMVQSLTKWGIAYVLQALDNGYYSITSAFGTQATELGGPAKPGDVGLVLSGNKDKIGSIVKIISVASQVEPRQYTGDILGSIQGNTGDNGVVYICTDSNPLTLMPTVGMSRSVTESSILPEGYSVGDMVLWLVGYNGNTYLTIWQFDTLESMTCIVVSAGLKGLTGDRGVQGPQGPVGPKGDKGDRGIQGPIGPQGPVGDTGPTGPQGPQGNSGAQGPIGPQGIQGPEGPAGPAGIANINSRGNYEAGLTYYKNDVVYWSGLGAEAGSYICSVVSTTGSPASSSSDWGFFVAQGPRGLQGPQGPQGIEGPEGPQGPQGEVGEAGPAGSQGPQGAVGPQGPVGPQGKPGLLTGVTSDVYDVVPGSGVVLAPLAFCNLSTSDVPTTGAVLVLFDYTSSDGSVVIHKGDIVEAMIRIEPGTNDFVMGFMSGEHGIFGNIAGPAGKLEILQANTLVSGTDYDDTEVFDAETLAKWRANKNVGIFVNSVTLYPLRLHEDENLYSYSACYYNTGSYPPDNKIQYITLDMADDSNCYFEITNLFLYEKVSLTGSSGTMSLSNFNKLVANEQAVITISNVIYRYQSNDNTNYYYVGVVDSNIKTITIDKSTRAWTLSTR